MVENVPSQFLLELQSLGEILKIVTEITKKIPLLHINRLNPGKYSPDSCSPMSRMRRRGLSCRMGRRRRGNGAGTRGRSRRRQDKTGGGWREGNRTLLKCLYTEVDGKTLLPWDPCSCVAAGKVDMLLTCEIQSGSFTYTQLKLENGRVRFHLERNRYTVQRALPLFRRD